VPVLTTGRLRLDPVTALEAEAIRAGRTPDGRSYAAGFPLPDTHDGLALFLRHGVQDFGFYLAVRRADELVVGEIGFVAPPVDGAVTIGYAIVPAERQQGYATEAIRAVATWALAEPGVREVHAQTLPGNDASVRALLRAGFEEVEVTEKLRRFVAYRGLSATSRPPSSS
jgi:RimJ/RimL family protein N-acetyltransferase